jgi:hypothetical protein
MATDTLALAPPRRLSLRPADNRHRRGPLRLLDLVALLGVAGWAWGLTRIDLGHMTDTGLISVLPPVSLVGLAVVAVAFVAQILTDPTDRWRPAAYIIVLVGLLDGLPCIIEQTGGIPTAYIHVGFAGYILTHGHVLNNYDARFSWPGMFAWTALATLAGGTSNAIVFVRWTPLVLDLLYMIPLRLILRRCCRDPRVAWLAAALFVVGNWTEQDYFSPQGFAYVPYLTVIAVALACSEPAGRLATAGQSRIRTAIHTAKTRAMGRDAGVLVLPSDRARTAVVVLLMGIMTALVASHQITPYGLLIELVILLLWGRLAAPSLVLGLLVLSVGYLSLGAENYWSGHLGLLFGQVGQVGGSVNSGVVQRTKVSPGHELVVAGRLVYTAALVGLAGLGLLARRKSAGDRGLVVALAVAPWSLVAMQSYGGEVFIRSLFLSLPFTGILVAEAAIWAVDRARRIGFVLVAAGLVVCSIALLVTRYGNEPFYRTTKTEIEAVHWVDTVAPTGSVIAVLDQDLPWRYEDIDRYSFVSYQAKCTSGIALSCFRKVGADYIIITQGEIRFAELDGGASQVQFAQLERDLPLLGYKRVLSLEDAWVWKKTGLPR